MRIEPPRSLPSASATMPAATAAALPPEEPPAESSGSRGCGWRRSAAFSVTGRRPSSGVFVLPTTIAPASRSRRTCALSWSATQSPNARAALAGRQALGGGEQVLDADRHAAERARVARRERRRPRPSARSAQTRDERVQLRVRGARSRASEAVDELARRDLAGADERRLLDGAQPQDVVVGHCHRLLVVQVDRSLRRPARVHMRAGTQIAGRRYVSSLRRAPWACAQAVAAARAVRPETPILP